MKKNLHKRLKGTNVDGGEELEGEPAVEHDVAGLRNLLWARRVGPNKALDEEVEDELLERDNVAGGAGFGDGGLNVVPHGVQVR